MDADAEAHLLACRSVRILLGNCLLDRDGALDRIHRTSKVGHHAVAGGIEDSTAVRFDQSIEDRLVGSQGAKRTDFVQPHKAAVLGDIGRKDYRELSFDDLVVHHRVPLSGAHANSETFDKLDIAFISGLMTCDLHGYATDIPYLRDFKPQLSPAWLDHVALVAGIEPPQRKAGFSWCDLGCGQGVTANILAATHPGGAFHAIDAMPVHIEHARRLAAEAMVPNVRFHCVDFAVAADLDLPLFDYIVAHGVYSWVDNANQGALRRFFDRRLKPGGLVYVSYNAMPGWARDLPFQRLVREFARGAPGDSAARVGAALEFIQALAVTEVPALTPSFIVGELKQRPEDYTPAYLVHELLPGAWQPLYVTEVRSALKTIGLAPVGSATLIENFDLLGLSPNAREMLGAVADGDLRELVRDFCLDQRFRRDVFARNNRRVDRDQRCEALMASDFALARPAATIRYSAATPAGFRPYNNPTARAIVGALANGPCSLAKMTATPPKDLAANVLRLCAIGDVMPVEPGGTPVGALNRAIFRRLDGPEEIHWLGLPCGTALDIDPGLMRRLRDGQEIGEDEFPGWRGFLASHGL
jgi:SAM-dependent methyltransferase